MPPRIIEGSKELGQSIKARREELHLTIEEAATRAAMGTKTWARYEAGESIRVDKLSGVLKALRWSRLPESAKTTEQARGANDPEKALFDRTHEAWSPWLEKTFGPLTAKYFAAGSDILLDEAEMDLSELSRLPRGTHLGQLPCSWIADYLPAKYLMRYDYEFLFEFIRPLKLMRIRTKKNLVFAKKPIEEIILFAICEQADTHFEIMEYPSIEDECPDGLLGSICGDSDVDLFLYCDPSPLAIPEDYLFENWFEDRSTSRDRDADTYSI